MLRVEIKLEGVSPISFGAPIQTEKETGESHAAFEKRIWRERMHKDKDGVVFIPPMALKHCLVDVAKFLGETVPGKGKATWTKHYKAGTVVTEPMLLGMKAGDVKSERIGLPLLKVADVPSERLFVPSDGRAGSGSRVWKEFPFIDTGWMTTAELILLDPLLCDNDKVVQRHLSHAGKFIGFGRFRPINGGFYGRFKVMSWATETFTGE